MKAFDPTFFQKVGSFQRQRLWSSSAEREIFLPNKNQDGRINSPVDCLFVGDPIRGSPEGRSMAALFYSCEVPSVLSISPSVSFADSSLIRRSLLYISQILPNSILFKGNLKAYCKKHFLEYTTCINFKYTK